MKKFEWTYILIFILAPCFAWAQLKQFPLEKKSVSKKITGAKITSSASLPFWDDFSRTSDGRPLDLLWKNNIKVFVSSSGARNLPTMNAAIFDGLNENGLPYSPSPNDILDFGFRDTLESHFIKMNEAPLNQRDSFYLSFFYQAGGNGEPPDPSDLMLLQLKSTDGWVDTLVLRPKPDPTIFYDTIIQISNPKYFHDEFQFRFISYGRKSGPYDSWHIDYVYLNTRSQHELLNNSIADRALTIPFTSILGDYYSIPYTHFISNPAVNFVRPFYEVYNMNESGAPQVIDYTSYFKIVNYNDGIENVSFNSVLDFQTNELEIPNLSRMTLQILNLPDISNFDADADSVMITTTLALGSGDNTEDYKPYYAPLDFRINDTLSHVSTLTNYYAYDDGVSEYMAGLTIPGNQLAYRFDMKTNGKDTINGVYFHFPYFAGTPATTMQLYVLDHDHGKPGEILYEQPVVITQTTHDEFVLIPLEEGVIVQDTFFISYRQPATGKIRVGLDKSHYVGDGRTYFRATPTSLWELNDLPGNFMIRPRFGFREVPITGLPDDQPSLSIYPNPNHGEFYIKGTADFFQLYSVTGQALDFSVDDLGDQKKISVHTQQPGVYILKYKSGNRIFSKKFIVTR